MSRLGEVAVAKKEGFTLVQQRLLAVLADGQPHRPAELIACLGDAEATIANVWPHLSRIRKIIRARGEDILCEISVRRMAYRWVRLLDRAKGGDR